MGNNKKKSKKKDKSSGVGKKVNERRTNRHDDDDDGGDGEDIVDERFAAAATRPQFRRSKLPSNDVPRDSSNAAGRNANANNRDGGTRKEENDASLLSASSSSGLLGASLTRAIASDDRFHAALGSDGEFGIAPGRDKYGRKAKKKKKKQKKERGRRGDDDDDDGAEEEGAEGDVSEGGEDEGVEGDDGGKEKKKKASKKKGGDDDDDDSKRDDSMETRIAYLNALSRGDISASSSDDDDSSSGSDEDDDDDSSASSIDIVGKTGIFDPSHAPLPGGSDAVDGEDSRTMLTDEPSPYLCILNLNWERVRAVDVYAMLHSFCPPGTLGRVEVYPSDFGRERMERERREGPTGLWKRGGKEEEEGEDDDDESVGSDGEEESQSDANSENDDVSAEGDDSDEDDSDDDVLDLADATAKLYAHFPPQSSVTKNSLLRTADEEEEGFDVEKLREYEASKLRYYFAVATFASSHAAEAAYENVDGMEMEGSAAEIDVRVLPESQYSATIRDRDARDACDRLPAKYVPPEDAIAVSALRQTRVTCSWERGDPERERALTRWGMGRDAWEAMAGGDDIGFYLATSDNSSEEEEEEKVVKKENGKKKKKGSGMRAMLGLEGSDDDSMGGESDGHSNIGDDGGSSDDDSSNSNGSKENDAILNKDMTKQSKTLLSSSSTESESDDEGGDDGTTSKQVTFIPGKRDLEKRIRSKISQRMSDKERFNDHDTKDEQLREEDPSTPFQKYLERRKEKRRERRRAARGGGSRKDASKDDDEGEDDDRDTTADYDESRGMYDADPEFGTAEFSDEEGGFFLDETTVSTTTKKKDKGENKKTGRASSVLVGDNGDEKMRASTKEELELLVAGDDDVENDKDYDMRGLARLERDSAKRLRGKRKRRHDSLAANVSGQDFRIDAADRRFAALLDGDDDGRFGIDRTNPAYRETVAMRELLEERARRRRRKGKGSNGEGRVNDGNKSFRSGKCAKEEICGRDGGWVEDGRGAMELSSLVRSLQQKVVSKKKKNVSSSLSKSTKMP